MAHVKLLSKESPLIRVCYFNDHGVGRGQPNRRDDVLLIQFLLHGLWFGKSGLGEVFGIPGKPALPIDGNCGTGTIEAIKRFQALYYANDSGMKVIEDGVVTAAPPGQSLGPLPTRLYDHRAQHELRRYSWSRKALCPRE